MIKKVQGKNNKEIIIGDFFRESFTDFSAYASYRSMGSYSDGLKNGQRKVIYTMQRKIKNNVEKVSRLASIVGLTTEYLHGEASLEQTISNLTRNWDKPLPILEEKGAFGSRTITKAASPRYIYTKKNENFDLVFPVDFYNIEVLQNFEGSKIEPKSLTPILPLLLINGNTGIGSGFAQNILPRNPKLIKEGIEKYLKSKAKDPSSILKKLEMEIYYPNFIGEIKREGLKTMFLGVIELKNTTTLEIKDLPIGETIESYLKVLEELIEKKLIVSYTDRSEDNWFNFIIKVKRQDLSIKKMSFDKDVNGVPEIIKTFKLIKSKTENFSCTGPKNDFFEFKNETEVLEKYIEFIMERYELLKAYKLNVFEELIKSLSEKARFIDLVIKNKIVISNKSRKDIENQLDKHKFINHDIYLSMKIYSLSKEKYEELLKEIEENKAKKGFLFNKTIKELYLDDLKKIKF